jgi:hypothetical protein
MNNINQQETKAQIEAKKENLINAVVAEMHSRGEIYFQPNGYIHGDSTEGEFINTEFSVAKQRNKTHYYGDPTYTGKLNVSVCVRSPGHFSQFTTRRVNLPEPKGGHNVKDICDRIEAYLKDYRATRISVNHIEANRRKLNEEIKARELAGLPKNCSIDQGYGQFKLTITANSTEELDKLIALLKNNGY